MRRPSAHSRRGFRRIEVLVVLVLLGCLIGLVLTAVQKARDAENRSDSSNRLKQLALCCHNFESAYTRLPPLIGATPIAESPFVLPDPPAFSKDFPNSYCPTHVLFMPYLEADPLYFQMLVTVSESPTRNCLFTNVALPNGSGLGYQTVWRYFCSPADPSLEKGLATDVAVSAPNSPDAPRNALAPPAGGCSYAANAQLFGKPDAIPNAAAGKLPSMLVSLDRASTIANVSDGAANTVAFAMKYARCGSSAPGAVGVTGGSLWGEPNLTAYAPIFAGQIDQRGNSPVGPNFMGGPGLKFQVRPNPWDGPNARGDHCDPRRAQTPFAEGMLVSMLDGSVRFVSPGVSVRTWEAAISPDDGVELGADW